MESLINRKSFVPFQYLGEMVKGTVYTVHHMNTIWLFSDDFYHFSFLSH